MLFMYPCLRAELL